MLKQVADLHASLSAGLQASLCSTIEGFIKTDMAACKAAKKKYEKVHSTYSATKAKVAQLKKRDKVNPQKIGEVRTPASRWWYPR